MTDKEIIIDGVDVGGCENLMQGIVPFGCMEDRKTCSCMNNPNCLYKQFKRKEQECEELETMVAEAEEALICFRCSEEPCIRQERDKYKQALDEIEQAISNFPSTGIQDILQTQIECTQYFLSVSETKLQKILDIINKAKRADK